MDKEQKPIVDAAIHGDYRQMLFNIITIEMMRKLCRYEDVVACQKYIKLQDRDAAVSEMLQLQSTKSDIIYELNVFRNNRRDTLQTFMHVCGLDSGGDATYWYDRLEQVFIQEIEKAIQYVACGEYMRFYGDKIPV